MSLSLLLVDNANVIFVVEANSSLSRQTERLEHVDTVEVRRDGAGPDLGFGVAARLQLPLLRSLRPFLTLATTGSHVVPAPRTPRALGVATSAALASDSPGSPRRP